MAAIEVLEVDKFRSYHFFPNRITHSSYGRTCTNTYICTRRNILSNTDARPICCVCRDYATSVGMISIIVSILLEVKPMHLLVPLDSHIAWALSPITFVILVVKRTPKFLLFEQSNRIVDLCICSYQRHCVCQIQVVLALVIPTRELLGVLSEDYAFLQTSRFDCFDISATCSSAHLRNLIGSDAHTFIVPGVCVCVCVCVCYVCGTRPDAFMPEPI